jgi:hypothetical protein
MTGREKCNKLKRVRAALADKLGIDLHQVACTFEGECTGTCPKCKQEEDALNAAILHKGAALAGAMMLATSMSACVPFGGKTVGPLDGGETVDVGGNELTGMVAYDPDGCEPGGEDGIEVLSGEVDERMLQEEDALTGDADGAIDVSMDDLTGYAG